MKMINEDEKRHAMDLVHSSRDFLKQLKESKNSSNGFFLKSSKDLLQGIDLSPSVNNQSANYRRISEDPLSLNENGVVTKVESKAKNLDSEDDDRLVMMTIV